MKESHKQKTNDPKVIFKPGDTTENTALKANGIKLCESCNWTQLTTSIVCSPLSYATTSVNACESVKCRGKDYMQRVFIYEFHI